MLAEQVRSLTDESTLINDSTTYSKAAGGWSTLHSYGNVTLAAASLCLFKLTINNSGAKYRLKIGSYYVWGRDCPAGGDVGVYAFMAWIPAGTYTVLLEAGGSSGPGASGFVMAVSKLVDQVGSGLAAYSNQISLTVVNRNTCTGPLKNAAFFVEVWGRTVGGQCNWENVGDSLTNGVSLSVDGSQASWTERWQDTASSETSCAYYIVPLTVGSAHTFTLTKRNANTEVHISVYACPWLLNPAKTQIITNNFSQGSTVYVTMEPLVLDPSNKFMGVGVRRGMEITDPTTNYYYSTSGSGIVNASYTFEALDPASTPIQICGGKNERVASGNDCGFGCIAYIGIDVR